MMLIIKDKDVYSSNLHKLILLYLYIVKNSTNDLKASHWDFTKLLILLQASVMNKTS